MDANLKGFVWKRKIGVNVSKSASSAFELEAKAETDPEVENGDVDWLTLVPNKRKNVIGLEDGIAKSHRLVQEGTVLASSERYWEALKKWDEALQYTLMDEKIHEMKAQALMELCEIYPAVQAAKKAVQFAPTWWIAHQTLGRAFLGLGEVRMAVNSFSRAVHLNPDDKELWKDDLLWAYSLLQKREQLEGEKEKQKEEMKVKAGVRITEIKEGNDINSAEACDLDKESCKTVSVCKNVTNIQKIDAGASVKKIPTNYVQMRDLPP
ncbi:tetratricopeptide repeat protein 33-like [Dreissena polymorpha]|uniref:Tetratricopeptide repeat protein 33 n=1 Tax=Dreissena polymorpha TaxID=45954 RepID=A0A9D4KZ90_DREPO|nr:tetratricopeptide repeat protein 33-like [Dreissena polymorpha]XP_052274148.1 tetratricopeptide repeat protein 33-like [Dreissena polymorpha]XP_052274149.1 tetratricopeptide repeat protein 33-like [Dreissena polymorpha]KAH3848885.1 hypothetical protein DPMN_091268 [Dreissena polymorpha]